MPVVLGEKKDHICLWKVFRLGTMCLCYDEENNITKQNMQNSNFKKLCTNLQMDPYLGRYSKKFGEWFQSSHYCAWKKKN